MSAIVKCQQCDREFEAKRSDTKYCRECYKGIRREYLREYDHKKRQDNCPSCGTLKGKRSTLCISCSNKRQLWRKVGEENSNWKGGRTKANGYIFIRTKRISGGAGSAYKAEHHIVWEQHYGKLPKGWVVHHLNGIRDDNRIENLVAMPRKSHSPKLIVQPYQERIRQLEAELRKLAPTKNIKR